jgi:PAS domain S-box-containing protein
MSYAAQAEFGHRSEATGNLVPRLASKVPWRSYAVRYGSALAVTVLTIALRFVLDPVLGRTGFAVYLVGMLLAAWVGGLGPSLICQTILLVSQALWFTPERGVHSPMTLHGLVSLIAFYSVGGIVGLLSELWYAARERERARHREAVSQREQLLTTLSCIADGVLVTGADGRVTLMNPIAEKMTGWQQLESQGKPMRDIFALCEAATQESVEDPVQRVLRENAPHHEAMRLLVSTRNDRQLPISYSAAPIRGSAAESDGVVIVLRDETDRLRSERALRNADRRKDEFLATLAHELRNPLAPISMGLELMKISADEPQAAEEVRAMMERQTQQMVRLIDDLLDVSRISRGKLELRRSQVDLASIVRNAVEAARPAIDEAGHKFTLSLPPQKVQLFADPSRLTQVLSNLLNNAAKFTPRGGQIELSGSVQDGELELVVTDNGHGIPSDKLAVIFDMFVQARDALESGHQGLGIGLTLVRRLVEMHGGSVTAQSDGPGKGSRFCVRLPVFEPTAVHGDARSLPADAVVHRLRRRVLVVDDNVDALKSLSMLVCQLGNEVFQASDGQQAIEAAEQYRPEVILMDLGMPKVSGYDAARRIREEPWGNEILLVATTGWGQDEDRRRTKDAGFDYHFVKPVMPDQIQQVLSLVPQVRPSCNFDGNPSHGDGMARVETEHSSMPSDTYATVDTNGIGSALVTRRNGTITTSKIATEIERANTGMQAKS